MGTVVPTSMVPRALDGRLTLQVRPSPGEHLRQVFFGDAQLIQVAPAVRSGSAPQSLQALEHISLVLSDQLLEVFGMNLACVRRLQYPVSLGQPFFRKAKPQLLAPGWIERDGHLGLLQANLDSVKRIARKAVARHRPHTGYKDRH